MPELPELEALCEALDPLVTRSPVVGAPLVHFAVLRTAQPPLEAMFGRPLVSARRRAKRLLFPAEGGPTLLVHLMSAGKMAFVEPGAKRPPGTIFALAFGDGSELTVAERTKRKQVRIGVYDEAGLAVELGGLGPEPLEPDFDEAALDAMLERGGQLHTLLRDQRAVAGIGRAYANEILNAALLSPFAHADRLDGEERARLLEAIRTTLSEGIERFRPHGARMPAKAKLHDQLYKVHGHAGGPCPRCSQELKFVDFAEHQVVYCPHCQTGGKVYADRRLSKLLR